VKSLGTPKPVFAQGIGAPGCITPHCAVFGQISVLVRG